MTIDGLPLLARFNPNPQFAPELMNGYELGYRRLLGSKVSLDIASFYNRYHDLCDEEISGPFYLENNPMPVHYLYPALFGNGLYGYTKGVERVLEALGRGVLTVGEGEKFLRDGGMIAMVVDNRRVRFDVNQAAATAGLSPGSRLLSVARTVEK